jgi:hypothetical protein
VLLSGNDINGLFFLLYLPKLWGGQVRNTFLIGMGSDQLGQFAYNINNFMLTLAVQEKGKAISIEK